VEQQLQDVSNVNPVAFIGLLAAAYLIWSLPRRFAVCPILAMTCLMPLGQDLVVFGLHFYLFRILLLVGLLRVLLKHEVAQLVMTRTDKIFIWWVIISIVFGTLAKPSMQLFINRLGDAYNAFGSYFLMRCFLVDFEDLLTSVRTLAWLSLPVAALMLVEKSTGHNYFSVFGGVPEITVIREGHLRCQGAFRHPILAGTFGATQFPLFIALWFYQPQYRRIAMLATIASLIIVGTASSSGALMALLASMGGMALWKWRAHMRLVRRGAVVAILIVAMIMNAPVWYLFDRLSSITGGTGWFRSYLIDQTIAHFNEWWLFGTTYTANWAPSGEVTSADPNMMDITNHYIAQGVSGGLLKLVLFLAIIVVSFKSVGRWLKVEGADSSAGILVWGAGVSLFAHCLSFVSTTYFDQIVVVWYWLLAMIASIPAWGNKVTTSDSLLETVGNVESEDVADSEKTSLSLHFWTGICMFRLFVARKFDKFRSNFVLYLEGETMIFRRFRTP
jgi:hypothetical protein